LLTVAWGQAQGVDYPTDVARARQENDLAAVNRLCLEWARKAPGNEKPRIILGQVYAASGMIDRALEQFELAAEANPLSPAPRCELGLLFLDRAMPEEALMEFGQALHVQADYLPAVLGSVRAMLMKGEPRRALAEAKRASASHRESATAHALVGECLWQLKASAEAEGAFAKALAIESDNPDALFGHARALEVNGDSKAAREYWQQFLEQEPEGNRADQVRKGWVVLRIDQLPATCRHYPGWSPDGRRIMYGYGTLGMIELQSGESVTLSAPGNEKLFTHDWSPDGESVLCRRLMPDRKAAVFLYDLSPDGSLQPAADAPVGDAAMGRFSPDGTKVALSGGSIVREGRRLFVGLAVFDLQTGTDMPVPWKHKTRTGRNHANWGPDGRTLVAHAYGKPNTNDRQLFILSEDGSTPPLQITDNGLMNLCPTMRPDGRSVAFETAKAEGPTISLVWADGVSEPVAIARGKEPAWSPDGRSLAYDTPEGIAIAHFGGLRTSPVNVETAPNGDALAVTVTAYEDMQTVNLRCEVFDEDSVRVEPAVETADSVALSQGELVEWPISMTPEQLETARTIKVTALCDNGRSVVKLVDWSGTDR
jgi:Tol biopolymer transport system component/Flp pilus assembly protein TadD